MSDKTKLYKMHIIMLGGHNLVQSKALPKKSIESIITAIALGQHSSRPDIEKVLAVPQRSGIPEYVVLPNIATFTYIEVDEDEQLPPW